MSRRGWLLLAAGVACWRWASPGYSTALVVSADLRLFMPAPRTEEQKLLVQNIGESPASRLLLVAIGGDEPAVLAAGVEELAAARAPRRVRPGRQRRARRARLSRRIC